MLNISVLHSYCKERLLQKFDPSLPLTVTLPNLNELHKGCYLGLVSSSNKDVAYSGFLQDKQSDVNKTLDKTIESFFSELRGKNITPNSLETGTLYLYLVRDVVYIPKPMDWDENKDGLYFMWGQEFRGLYLPYQIKLMSCSKVEVLDRLCSHLIGIPSSMWRLPEGLLFRIITY